MIDEGSRDAMVKVGWKRNLVWPRSRDEENRYNNDCDHDSYDHYGRKGPLTPLPMHLLEYLLLSGLSQTTSPLSP